ncbi:MAG TPA: hypothetical protein VF297_32415 [Pyrinomonadaceae bacterium]
MSTVPDFDTFVRARRPAGTAPPDFDSFVRERRAPAARAPRTSLPPVDPRLDDFILRQVIPEASRRSGYTYKLGEGSRTAEQQAEKVARGVSWTYNSAHMHGRGRDVLAFDERGNYITDGSHPAYAALGEAYGALAPKAPVKVKWGVLRNGVQADPGHFQLDGDSTLSPGTAASPVPDFDSFVSERRASAGDVPDFDTFKASRAATPDPLAGVDLQPGEEVVREAISTAPPPSRGAPAVDAQTRRARRDAALRAERDGGAFYRIPVGRGTAMEATDAAASYLAKEVDAPVEFVRGWLGRMELKDPQTGQPVTSSTTGYATISPQMVGQLRRDYSASLNLPTRAVRNVSEVLSTHDPGEIFVGTAGAMLEPAGAALSKGADVARRAMKPLDMFSARLWTRLGGGTPEQARAASDAVWNDEPLPAYAENFVAQDVERDMARLNPRIGKAYGVLTRFLTDPTNFVPVGGAVKLADKFADGVRAFRAARGAEEVAEALATVERVVDDAADVARAGGAVERGAGREALEGLGYRVERVPAPNRAAGGEAPEVWKVTGADGRVNFMRDDAELDDFADYVGGRASSQNVLTSDARPGAGRVIDRAGLERKAREHNMTLEEVRDEAVRQGYTVEGFDAPPAAQTAREAVESRVAEDVPDFEEFKASRASSSPRTAADVAEDIRVTHARERAEFYTQEAARASTPAQRAEAEALAREYADEAAEARVSNVAERVKRGARVEPEEMADLERAVIGEDGAPAFIEVNVSAAPAPAAGAAARVKSPLRRAWDAGLDALDATKSAFASLDASAAGRQAFVPFLFDTRATVKGLREGAPSVVARHHSDFARWLDSQPDAKMWQDFGLDLDTMTGSGTHNEFFTSRLAEKVPVYGDYVVKPSDRLMTAQLDAVRLQNARSWERSLRRMGVTPETHPEDYKAVAKLINTASGRAELGRVGQAIYPVTRRIIFSPKLLKSRFTILNPLTYAKLPPAARRVAARRLGSAAAKMAGVFGLAYLTADEVGLNPFKGDFGHARYGNTTYDLTGGVGGKLRTVFQLVYSVGHTANAYRKGESVEYKDTPWGIGAHFLRSQLAPSSSLPIDAVTGETFDHKPFTWTEGVLRRVTPGFAQDVYEGWVEGSGPLGAVKALPSFLGISTRTRDREELKREWAAAREASKKAHVRERTADVLKDAPTEVRDDLLRLRVSLSDSDASLSGEIAAAVERARSGPGWSGMNDAARKKFLENIIAGVRKEAGAPSAARAESAGRAKDAERVQLTGAAAEEVERLGVVIEPVFAGHKVGVFTGESVGFKGEHLGQTPEQLEEYRRQLARETQAEVERVMAFEGFGSQPDEVKRGALQAAVDRVKTRLRGQFHFQTRERDYGEHERLEEYQRELEGRSRQLKPGETLKLGTEGGGGATTVNPLMNFDGERTAPAEGAAGHGRTLKLEGVRESTNVEDVRAEGPFDPVVAEIRRAGPSPVTEAQATDAALLIDSLDERRFLSFARNLADDGRLGVAAEGAAAAFEYGARAAGALGSSDASDAAGVVAVRRMLAWERRLRPEQFARDALAGRYGAAVRSEVEEGGILTPPPERVVAPGRRPAHEEIRRAVDAADPEEEPAFQEFPEGISGTTNMPRMSMPQIKSEHRGALVRFLQGRGITHRQETVPAGSLKASQAEWAPEKVKRALGFEGPERSILISSDDHVADGHHQWLSVVHEDPERRIPVIRLDAPIRTLLIEMARFPSSTVDDASAGGRRAA